MLGSDQYASRYSIHATKRSSAARSSGWSRLGRAGSLMVGCGSLFLQAHVLIGRGEVELRVQADPGLLDPRADSVQGGGVEDRTEHDALVDEALDPVQERLTLLAVALLRLLLEQVVDLGIPSRGVRRAADDEGFEAHGGVARLRRDRYEDAAELLRAPRLHERRPLHAAHARANAHRGEVVAHGLPHGGERRERGEVAGVETIGIPGLPEEALRLRRVVRIRVNAEREVHDTRDHRPRQALELEALR